MSPWLVRRIVIDRVAAALLLVVLSPVIALAALVKRLEDKGPAFVRIPRVGRVEQPLHMVKIRSMHAAASGGLAVGPCISSGNDSRTTPVGRILRRSHLDELPQLLHVAGGSMSLFGPRPEAPQFVTSDPAWAVVLSVPPGIAGPTQLLFEEVEAALPSEATADFYAERVLPLKLDVDQWYVTHASPATDARVMAGLVQRFVLRENDGLAEKLAVLTTQLIDPARV